jgi:hypothetical protein
MILVVPPSSQLDLDLHMVSDKDEHFKQDRLAFAALENMSCCCCLLELSSSCTVPHHAIT